MKRSSRIAQLGLLAVVSVACLLLSEGAIRLVLRPVDFLTPTLVEHHALRHALEGGSGGHDAWGFRNRGVPSRVDVAVLGDSQTYGHSAPAVHSWPSHLARQSGLEVYNLGVGGYGPADYHYLLRETVPKLDPEVVLVGLYFGNDVKDAFRSVYKKAYWAGYRDPGIDGKSLLQQDVESVVDLNTNIATQSGLLGAAREWLGRHSVLYRALGASVVGALVHGFEHRTAEGRVAIEVGPVRQSQMLDVGRLSSTDLGLPAIRHGLDLTLRLLSEMAAEARAQGRRFGVVLIPTKHLVLEQDLVKSGVGEQYPQLLDVVRSEESMRTTVRVHLEEEGIAYVDALPALVGTVGRGERPYPEAGGHPNGVGYSQVARAALPLLEGH